MTAKRLQELTQAFDATTLELLGPLRMTKTLDQAALGRAISLVKEIGALLAPEASASKELVGKLWFVFTAMLAEAGHARDTRAKESIEAAAWRFVGELEEIFGPRF